MSNYNKVKTEGVEAIKKLNLAGLDGWQEKELVDFLSTYAEKLDKARLEDILEFVVKNKIKQKNKVPTKPGEYILMGQIMGNNDLVGKLKGYIKTLTK